MNVADRAAVRPLAPRPHPGPGPETPKGSLNSAFAVADCAGSRRGARAGYSRLQTVTWTVTGLDQQNQQHNQSGYKLQPDSVFFARARAHARDLVTL